MANQNPHEAIPPANAEDTIITFKKMDSEEKENYVGYVAASSPKRTVKTLNQSLLTCEDDELLGIEIDYDDMASVLCPLSPAISPNKNNSTGSNEVEGIMVESPFKNGDSDTNNNSKGSNKVEGIMVESPFKNGDSDANNNSKGSNKVEGIMVESPFKNGDSDAIGLSSAALLEHNNKEDGDAEENIGADHRDAKVVDHNKNPSTLYNLMQAKNWVAVMAAIEQDPDLASTWIRKKENDNEAVKWCLLPIHAAVILKAPSNIISKLLSLCPESGLYKADHGMVPLHLALRHGSSESVLYELLSACPEAVDAKDDKGRTPLTLHNTYVSRAYATKEHDPITLTEPKEKNKKRTSALDKFVTLASTRARKSTKADLEAFYGKKLKSVQDEHTQQLNNLRKLASDEFTTVREKHKELEKKAKSFQLDLDKMRKIIKELSDENSNDESRLTELERFVSDIKGVRDEEVNLNLQKVTELEGYILTLHNKHEQQVSDIVSKVSLSEYKASELCSKIDSVEEEIKLYKKSILDLEAEYLDLLTKVDHTMATNEELSLKYEEIYEREKDLRTKIAEKESAIVMTTSLLEVRLRSVDSFQEELNGLRQDRNCHQSTILVLSSDLEALAAESKEQVAILDELTKRNSGLSKAAETLRMEYEAKYTENQSLTEQLVDLCVEADRGSEQVKEAEKKSNRLKGSLLDLTSKLTVKEDSVNALLKEKANKQDDFEQCKSLMEEEKDRLILNIAHQGRQISEYELKLSELHQSVEALTMRIEKKTNNVNELRNELEEAQKSSIEEHKSKDSQLQRMTDALADYATKFEDLILTTESLKEQLKSKFQEEEKLRSELMRSQNEFVEIAALKENEYCTLMERFEKLQRETSEIKSKINEMEIEISSFQHEITETSQNMSCAASKISELQKAVKDSDDAFEMAENASKEKQSQLEEKAHLADLNVFDLREKEKMLEKCIENLERMVTDAEKEIAEVEITTMGFLQNLKAEYKKMENLLSEVSNVKTHEIQELQFLLEEKDKEESAILEKMHAVEEIKEQVCHEVEALEEAKNMAEDQMNNQITAFENICRETENKIVELSLHNARCIEKNKSMVLEAQGHLESNIKHLRLENDKTTQMNQSLQNQVTEITLMIKKETEMLLNLSAKHKKYQDFAESNGVSMMEFY
jgi:chromosome segregation ATPase